MATQADYRMILGIKQQPNQWAEALSNLPGNLMQGMQIGDYFRQRSRESQLQELMRGAIDPQTGEMDTGKALGALMQFDPATGIKLMQQDRLARMQSEGLQVAMSGDYTPEERQILQGYAATGEIGKGIAKIGELRYGRSTVAENRAQELIPGVVNTPNGPVEVTDTRENWARYRQQLQSGSVPQSQPQAQPGAVPQGQPQAQIGQVPAIGSNLTPSEQQAMQAPPQAGDMMDKAAWDRLRTRDPEGARAFLRKMSLQQRNLFLQAMYAESGPQVVIPAMSSQSNPVNPAATGLPAGAIQRGLSPAQQQEIKRQEENRANQEARERAALEYNRGAPERIFNKENQLRDEFNNNLKTYYTVQDRYGAMLESMRVAKTAADTQTKGISDIALVYSFMKVLDPTSVVREGEYATAANAGGVPDKIMNYYNKVLQGDQLPDAVRDSMMRQGELLYTRAKELAIINQKRYSTLAIQNGLNPENVVYDIEGKSLPSVANFLKQLEAEKANTASQPAAATPANKIQDITPDDIAAAAADAKISPQEAERRLLATGKYRVIRP